MNVLVFNCGSSSIKYQLFGMPSSTVLAKGSVDRIGSVQSTASQTAGDSAIELSAPANDHHEGFELIRRMLTDPHQGAITSFSEIGACGHRVVHGGEKYTEAVRIDDTVAATIEEFSDLAPLHNPPNLVGIREAMAMTGEKTPQVACFDTAFHQTMPEAAWLYALPYELYEGHRIRRYGFHGTSHRYVAARAARMLGKQRPNLITCHLGNGCSATAVREGRSVDTSLGMTPLEGLVMGTRSGDVDPGVLFYLARKGYTPPQLDTMLNKKSGVLGISGVSNDLRDVHEAAAKGNERAKLALEIFAYRVRKYIGAYLAVLDGCDALVFTGGIGENGTAERRRILAGLDHLGIKIDNARNESAPNGEAHIHADDSRIKVLVIPTNEEAAIATDTYEIVTGGGKIPQ